MRQRKLKDIATTELYAFLKSSEKVCAKCDRVIETTLQIFKVGNSEVRDIVGKLMVVRNKHFDLIQELQGEIERRLARDFNVPDGRDILNLTSKLQELADKLPKEDNEESVTDSMKVVK